MNNGILLVDMRRHWVGIFAAILFTIFAVGTISSYGLNEDIPFHFLRGQAYLEFFLSGRKMFSQPRLESPVFFIPGQRISQYKLNAWETNLAPIRPIVNYLDGASLQAAFRKYESKVGRQSFYKHNAWNASYFIGNDGPGHPPGSDILAALVNRIAYEKLGIFGDIESYDLYPILTGILVLVLVYIFAAEAFGITPALFAATSLALFPIFFAELHYNLKDIPELAFFTGSITMFYIWIRKRKFRYFAVFLCSLFLGTITKLNIAFVPIILVFWLILRRNDPDIKQWLKRRNLIYLGVGGVFLLIMFILSWPYLWDAPIGKVLGLLSFYSETGSVDTRIQQISPYALPGGIDLMAVILVLASTPLLILIGAVIGSIKVFRMSFQKHYLEKTTRHTTALVLLMLWFMIPLLRVLRPGADIFGSIRQYMEFLPAWAIIAGMGMSSVTKYFSRKLDIAESSLVPLVWGIFAMLLGWNILQYYPNENLFYNSLVGGPTGAFEKRLYEWQSAYDNPYKQAIDWLNVNAPGKATIAYLDGTMEAMSPRFMRDDLYLGSFFTGFEAKGEYIVSTIYRQPPNVFPYLYVDRFLTPVYEVTVKGQPVLRVWKNDPQYRKSSMGKMETLSPGFWKVTTGSDSKLGRYWEVQLENEYKITSLSLSVPKNNCKNRDGIFWNGDFTIPFRSLDRNGNLTVSFAGDKTRVIRYFEMEAGNCLSSATVTDVSVLEDK